MQLNNEKTLSKFGTLYLVQVVYYNIPDPTINPGTRMERHELATSKEKALELHQEMVNDAKSMYPDQNDYNILNQDPDETTKLTLVKHTTLKSHQADAKDGVDIVIDTQIISLSHQDIDNLYQQVNPGKKHSINTNATTLADTLKQQLPAGSKINIDIQI